MFDVIPQHHNEDAIEALLDAAFGSDRKSKASYSFRSGVRDVAALRLVAQRGGELLGTIRFWPVLIDGTPALLLGPLGVDPAHQSTGIGAALIEHGLELAREKGHAIVLLVGELSYYGRFGFAPASAHHITMPGEQGHRLLVRELQNDALEGVEGAVASLAAR